MSIQFVIKYDPCFKKADLVKVKLKTITPKAEEQCAVFDNGGIELLLYVFEDFDITMECLGIGRDNYDELKKYFKKVLGHGPAEKLRKLIHRNLFINTVLQKLITVHAFEKLKKAFIKLYCTCIPNGRCY